MAARQADAELRRRERSAPALHHVKTEVNTFEGLQVMLRADHQCVPAEQVPSARQAAVAARQTDAELRRRERSGPALHHVKTEANIFEGLQNMLRADQRCVPAEQVPSARQAAVAARQADAELRRRERSAPTPHQREQRQIAEPWTSPDDEAAGEEAALSR